jgi:signal transduction histidine kinase
MKIAIKRSTLGQKLTGGFLIVALFAAIVGGVGIFNIRTIDKADTKLYEKFTVPIGELQEMISSYWLIRLTLQELQYETDATKHKEQVDKVQELLETIDHDAAEFETSIITKEGHEHFQEFKDIWEVYKVDLKRAVSLVEQGNRTELSLLLNGAIAKNGARACEVLVEQVNSKIRQAKRTSSENNLLSDKATLLMSLFTVAAIFLGFGLGWIITKGVKRQLGGEPADVAELAGKVARGDLSTLIDTEGKDPQSIIVAMQKMTDAIRALVKDAGTLTKAAMAGNLAARADASGHQGDFRDLVTGFNMTLDAVIAPLNVSAEYVDRISKGDIPPKITAIYYGDFNEIKVNLNNCIDIMNNLLGETDKVLLAAADGKLDERADADLFIGGWRQLVLGVNNIVTNIVNPLRRTTTLLNNEIAQRRKDQELLQDHQHQLELLNSQLEERVADAVLKNREMDQALMQSEKMASIGQLAAGVAHEINNPMGYISSNLRVLADYFVAIAQFDQTRQEFDKELAPQRQTELSNCRESLDIETILEDGADLISESLSGAKRVAKIVLDLKSFSRVDALEYELTTLDTCLESALTICYNELKYVATIHKLYEPVPTILCHPGQLNQVFLNLLINAGQAITPPGDITLKCWHDARHVYASVSDTGKGIPDEIRDKIFNPFFTTKDVGEGTGLGLSISYEIIKKQRGDILVESRVGEGTTFTIKLPRTAEI